MFSSRNAFRASGGGDHDHHDKRWRFRWHSWQTPTGEWFHISNGRFVSILQFLTYKSGVAWSKFQVIFFLSHGVTKTQLGIMRACATCMKLLGYPLWGIIADVTKNFKATLIASLLLSNAVIVVLFWPRTNTYLFSPSYFVALLFIRSLRSFSNAVSSLTDTITLSLISEKKSYGKHRLFASLGAGLGSLICGYLIDAYGINAIFSYHCFWNALFLLFLVYWMPNMNMNMNIGTNINTNIHANTEADVTTVMSNQSPAAIIVENSDDDYDYGGIGIIHDIESKSQDVPILIRIMNNRNEDNNNKNQCSSCTHSGKHPYSVTRSHSHSHSHKHSHSRSRSVSPKHPSVNSTHRHLNHNIDNNHRMTVSVNVNRQMRKRVKSVKLLKTMLSLRNDRAFVKCVVFIVIYFVCKNIISQLIYIQMEQEFHTNRSFMGLCVAVSTAAEYPFFYHSHYFIDRFDANTIVLVCHLTLFIRIAGYSLITSESMLWLYLVLQSLHGITFALMWSVLRLYFHNIGTKYSSTELNVQGSINSLLGILFTSSHGLGFMLWMFISDYFASIRIVYCVGCVLLIPSILVLLQICMDADDCFISKKNVHTTTDYGGKRNQMPILFNIR